MNDELARDALALVAVDEARRWAQLAQRCGIDGEPTPTQRADMKKTMHGASIGIAAEVRRLQVAVFNAMPGRDFLLKGLVAQLSGSDAPRGR